jgi:acetylornithine deacetylase/succinyl-diaminopimelate desuccinylase-like protein
MNARVPTVLTGFSLPSPNFHGPNEELPVSAITAGASVCARALELMAAVRVDRASSRPEVS